MAEFSGTGRPSAAPPGFGENSQSLERQPIGILPAASVAKSLRVGGSSKRKRNLFGSTNGKRDAEDDDEGPSLDAAGAAVRRLFGGDGSDWSSDSEADEVAEQLGDEARNIGYGIVNAAAVAAQQVEGGPGRAGVGGRGITGGIRGGGDPVIAQSAKSQEEGGKREVTLSQRLGRGRGRRDLT